MLMGFAALVALALALCLGGSLSALGALRLRQVWLLPTALMMQVLIVNVVPGLPRFLAIATHLLTYVMAGAFLALNLRIHGIPVIAAGTLANALGIAVNGGVLPASASALRSAGWMSSDGRFANSAPVMNPHLAFLGDNYVTPDWLPYGNVYSIGDIVIILGISIVVYRYTRTVPRRSGAAASGRLRHRHRREPSPGRHAQPRRRIMPRRTPPDRRLQGSRRRAALRAPPDLP